MTQCDRIRDWLMAGNTLTALEALERFGCIRLPSRVYDLRSRGVPVKGRSKRVTTRSGEKKTVTEYYID